MDKIYIDQQQFRDRLFDYYPTFAGELEDVCVILDNWCCFSQFERQKYLESKISEEKLNCDITYMAIANIMINNKTVINPAQKSSEIFTGVKLPKRLPRKHFYYNNHELIKISKCDIDKNDY